MIRYRQAAALWTQVGYPSFESEYELKQKIESAAEAGFDVIQWDVVPGLREMLDEFGMDLWGYIPGQEIEGLEQRVDEIADAGARYATVHLLKHDTEPEKATDVLVRLVSYAKEKGLTVAIETHRNTATETPEKFEQILTGFKAATGELMPVTWDFSHFGVVKHLMPDEYSERLLVWPELIRNSPLFHCRPFNGHHVQVPVTGPDGELTVEVKRYLSFVKDLFRLWLDGDQTNEEIIVCPEMGPADEMGYNLQSLPNSWDDARVLRGELKRVWDEVSGA